MRILIIEDETTLRNSIAEGLRMDGYEIDSCQDGLEAPELCEAEHCDLILLSKENHQPGWWFSFDKTPKQAV